MEGTFGHLENPRVEKIRNVYSAANVINRL